jgi:hypothetical protein
VRAARAQDGTGAPSRSSRPCTRCSPLQ